MNLISAAKVQKLFGSLFMKVGFFYSHSYIIIEKGDFLLVVDSLFFVFLSFSFVYAHLFILLQQENSSMMVLPKDFEVYFRARWLGDDVEELIRGLDGQPSTSIRLNTAHLSLDTQVEGADGRVPWCPEGIYLKERPTFTADPLLHAGAYYVQEASSMFLAHIMRTILPTFKEGSLKSALDLCAAPGGKSTLLRSLLPDECLLLSNEPLRARALVLAENMSKWGHPNVVVSQTYASEIAHFIVESVFSSHGFDLVLADVPCSGEGMMRKEEEAVRQWSPSFVDDCAALQRSIVADIWPALRPGGILIYSTCTFNPEEDEENVEWIARELGADVVAIPVESTWGIRGDMRQTREKPLACYHFLPGQVRGEGFFAAVLRKHGNDESADDSSVENVQFKRKKDKRKGKGQKARPLTFKEELRESLPTLSTTQLDIPEGDSVSTSADWPRVELSLTDAVRYLQREALTLSPDVPHGIVQVCFRGHRLGFVKNLGSRANNLYPKEWRIRSGFIKPETILSL